MRSFECLAPETIQEACSLLSKYKSEAMVIAGGTDLLVLAKSREVTPAYVVSLEAIPDLDYIRYDGKNLEIGALTTIHAVESSTIIKEQFPVLAEAARQMGSPQVRNMATVVGNLCRASPSADMATVLLALGAKVKIASAEGERLVEMEDFFTGPGKTVLGDNELVIEVQVPAQPPNTFGAYLKMTRRAIGIAQVSVAAIITFDSDHKSIVDARLALGAVASTVFRAEKAEDILRDNKIAGELIDKAAQAASEAARPISDIRAPAEYRRDMVRVMVSRAIRQIIGAAGGGRA